MLTLFCINLCVCVCVRACARARSRVCVCVDRLCFLVVRVPGCRSKGPGFFPGATRYSEK
jgi:hypothetical protein